MPLFADMWVSADVDATMFPLPSASRFTALPSVRIAEFATAVAERAGVACQWHGSTLSALTSFHASSNDDGGESNSLATDATSGTSKTDGDPRPQDSGLGVASDETPSAGIAAGKGTKLGDNDFNDDDDLPPEDSKDRWGGPAMQPPEANNGPTIEGRVCDPAYVAAFSAYGPVFRNLPRGTSDFL
eukprot:TRINITY_DN76791_c0_g1_i1.p1 TRINITY_DN76791_c0_g1~~TRINITY_DN76791_c0_g1_i1.p1  ORF type:complete len:186 (-),score=23.31 TRINITY_DN76791_c0_g1_i1:11-568(-)